MNQVPVVIDEGSCFDSNPFLYSCRWRWRRLNCRVKPLHCLRRSAVAIVVCVENPDRAVGEGARGNGTQLVLGVVGVGPNAIGGKTSVSVVMKRSRRYGGAKRSSDLVEIVVRICVGHGIVAEEQMVTDVVVGMGKEISADSGRNDFATVVVGEGRVNGQDTRCPSRARHRAGEGVKGITVGVDKRGIEVGCAVRHEVAAVLIAADSAPDRIAVQRRDRVAVAVPGNVRVGDGEGSSGRVRGSDARQVAIVIVGVTEAALGLVVDGKGKADRAVKGIV